MKLPRGFLVFGGAFLPGGMSVLGGGELQIDDGHVGGGRRSWGEGEAMRPSWGTGEVMLWSWDQGVRRRERGQREGEAAEAGTVAEKGQWDR